MTFQCICFLPLLTAKKIDLGFNKEMKEGTGSINGFGFVWLNQYVENENCFLNMFEQRIKDSYHQEWNSQVNLTSDYRLFKKIKQAFIFEKYLHMGNNVLRTAITKIRLSSLFSISKEVDGESLKLKL